VSLVIASSGTSDNSGGERRDEALNHHLLMRIHSVPLRLAGMTVAEVGTFLGSGSTNGPVFGRSDPRTTTAPQPSPIMKPVRSPWKSGPVFNASVDSWVALANLVSRLRRESTFHMPAVKRLGRPRETDLRAVVDAILYIARSGCQWRLLPKDFPPFTTVQGYF
jgi:Putative transposase of IS4/5 family (DUF4096)